MYELLFAIVSLYFCNKLIRLIIVTPHTIQINGSCDQTFKIDLFLVQALRICNHARVHNSWSCIYMAIHTCACQDMYVFTYVCVVLRVFHKTQVCYTQGFCVYTFCVCLSWGWFVPYDSIQCSDSRIFVLSFPIYIFTELLFELFEPLSTSHSMQYDNGQDWEDMRKWLYEYPIPVYYLQMILKFLVILKDNDTCKLQQDNVKYY